MGNYLAVTIRIRVGYDEHGNTGYAFNGNYFIWMKQAVKELFGVAGLEDFKFSLTVQNFSAVDMDCNFKSPIKINDVIEVKAFVEGIGISTIHIHYDIYRGGKKLANGNTEHAYVDTKSREVIPLPDDVKYRLFSTHSTS